ncbi:MAG: DUF4906 domain-containing protein [Rikenellaceae bacterium]|nr:DUF4906 domain-containing protein [Rikenellaceae bacterium]
MKRFFNIFAIALASVLMFSCQEDADVDNFGFGGTVKGKFSLVVPSNEMVEITRATEEQESDVTSVHLFFFDHNSKDALGNESVTLGTATQSGNYTRTYNITTTTSFDDTQVVDIYAIANTESSLGNVADFTAVAGNSNDFTKLLMSLELLNTPFSTMTMSGKLEGVAASKDFGLTGNIQVKRPYAKVNFTIKNGNSNFTFTPTQYNVKNVPTSGAVFEGGVASDVKFKNYDGMTDFVENQGAQVIEFYMLENKAGKAEGVANYNDRELRKDATKEGKHDEFAHGLANATYVEILGEGKGTNAAGEPISATVKYTIHLGDFAADATDFNVNRNTFYNYTVTVNGVENIVVEAESTVMDDEKFQHGAEGTVINLKGSTMVYTLDAHYEQVLLNLNLTKLPTDDDDVVLVVSTPYMDEANKGAMITWSMIESADFGSKFDTEWVEFYPSNALCAYPSGNSKLMKTVDFLKYVRGLATDGDTSNDKLSVVAFINEYFYSVNPLDKTATKWQDFVNKEDRVMRILQAPKISADGHSISTKALCAFTQRSIRTVFNTNLKEGIIFGLETYDETGAISEYGSASSYSSSIITESKHGYGADGQPNGNVYNALAQKSAANACQQRNRAGSNNVWKLASPTQYTAIWLGEVALPNEAKLYKGNPADNITTAPGWNGSYNGVYQHWASGTDTEQRIFWHVEGAAFSSTGGARASGHFTRCVRDLGSGTTVPNATTGKVGDLTAVIVNSFTDGAYRGIATENLPVHHERDAANKVTKAFVLASGDLSATWTAMSDAPAAPQIVSVEKTDNSLIVKFVNKDTYVYAKSNTTTISDFTNVVLGAENSVVINNPSGTYYFRTKRNYNTLSQYVTVNADGTFDNSTDGTNNNATNAVSISANTRATTSIPLMAAIYQDLCAQWKTDGSAETAWRVPNQKELLLIRELDLDRVSSNNTRMVSSTLFSARNLTSTDNDGYERYGYSWYYHNWGISQGYGLVKHGYTGIVRCVRDASEAELQSLGISNSGDQVDGGNA